MIKQLRDITIIDIDENRFLGISCDSCGGVGEKEHDYVAAPAVVVGEQTAKVALAELLCMGFTPMVLSDGLCVEMEDTGRKIIEGFNKTIGMLRHSNVHLTGSTEENMKTVQTSIGVTGIGIIEKSKIKYKKTQNGDFCVLLGVPLVGLDVINNPDKILSISDYEILSQLDFVKEILPVGSKGIDFEINLLCECNDLKLNKNRNISADLTTSGGPSCCCVLSIEKDHLDKLEALIDKPIETLGVFVEA